MYCLFIYAFKSHFWLSHNLEKSPNSWTSSVVFHKGWNLTRFFCFKSMIEPNSYPSICERETFPEESDEVRPWALRCVYSTLIHNCTKNAKVHLTNHWQQNNGTLIKIWKGNIFHSYFYICSVVKFHTVALVYDKQLQKIYYFPFITISNRLEWHNMWYKYNSIRHDSGSSCCVVKNRQDYEFNHDHRSSAQTKTQVLLVVLLTWRKGTFTPEESDFVWKITSL